MIQARFVAIGLFAVTFALYSPTLSYGFVNMDDLRNFVQNEHFRGLGWSNLRWMWTTMWMGPYQPLSWMSLGLDYTIWGLDDEGNLVTTGYHLTNVLLHSLNVVLVFGLVLRLFRCCKWAPRVSGIKKGALPASGGDDAGSPRGWTSGAFWGAVLAALLFGLHPLRVEVVAWSTERRELLSTTFLLCSVTSYLRAGLLRGRATRRDRRWAYAASLLFFTLSLLAKAIGMTLPVLLLFLDKYPLRRVRGGWRAWLSPQGRRVLIEKLPYVLLAIPIMCVAFVGQQTNSSMVPLRLHSVPARLATCCYGLIWYLRTSVFPVNLGPLYPLMVPVNPLSAKFLPNILAVIGLTCALWILRRRAPSVWLAWVSYVILVSPVIGIVQTGPQIAADRYSYLSCIPWAALVGFGFGRLWDALRPGLPQFDIERERRLVQRGALGAITVLLLALLSTLTFTQQQLWSNSLALWEHVERVTAPNPTAEVNVATLYEELGRTKEAEARYIRALSTGFPANALACFQLGNMRTHQGRYDEAGNYYAHALQLAPNSPRVFARLGVLFYLVGQPANAEKSFQRAIAMQNDLDEAYVFYGTFLVREKRWADAVAQLQQALALKPRDATAHYHLAIALRELGETEAALEHLRAYYQADGDKQPTDAELRAELPSLSPQGK